MADPKRQGDAAPVVDLDAAEARAAAATPGPWEVSGGNLVVRSPDDDEDCDARPDICEVSALDAAFIAHARADVPALVAYARRLDADLAAARALAEAERAYRVAEVEHVRATMRGTGKAAIARVNVTARALRKAADNLVAAGGTP